ncbi:MAG TPA: chemotaxis protein CheW [Sandaracinaceae bacterium LLY-WYZ-13_1]|nr:chemotaxis protein CheW [Sandaracinaceae bacterium LLY-WYZ-13_1]
MPARLGGIWFALDASAVREVLGRVSVTSVPGGPVGLMGVIPWRGRAVAVLDVAPMLGGTHPSQEPRNRTVVLESSQQAVALPVDGVREARPIAAPRPAHAVRMPHASLEVEVDERVMALFDLNEWLATLGDAA